LVSPRGFVSEGRRCGAQKTECRLNSHRLMDREWVLLVLPPAKGNRQTRAQPGLEVGTAKARMIHGLWMLIVELVGRGTTPPTKFPAGARTTRTIHATFFLPAKLRITSTPRARRRLVVHLYARVCGEVPCRGREHVLGGGFPAIPELARFRSDVSHDGRDLICSQRQQNSGGHQP